MIFDVDPKKLDLLIEKLWKRLGRCPTENEVMVFIMGTRENRLDIWNQSGSWER